MKITEEDLLQKTAIVLEALIGEDEANEAGADAMGSQESALFHESRGTALSYALSLVQGRARATGIALADFEFPEDKTTNQIIAEVACRRPTPLKTYTITLDEMSDDGQPKDATHCKVMGLTAENEERAVEVVLDRFSRRYPTRTYTVRSVAVGDTY